jgi:hypothetical protein
MFEHNEDKRGLGPGIVNGEPYESASRSADPVLLWRPRGLADCFVGFSVRSLRCDGRDFPLSHETPVERKSNLKTCNS